MSVEAFWSLSETEQDDWRARLEVDRETCKFHGGPVEECGDDDRDWFSQMSICWPSAQLAAAQALFADLHEDRPFHNGSPERFTSPAHWAKERSAAFPFHYGDGVAMWLSPVDLPGPDFLAGSQQLAGNEDEDEGSN